jgi:histidine triad (HIT) family protein
MNTCPFCMIATRQVDAVRVHEDDVVTAFLDRSPIRPGHTQIITKRHVQTFEDLPAADAARLLTLGQQLARRMKAVYGVERVAFLFTGGDVAHVHAHVVPMHAKTDITSARYIVSSGEVEWSATHLHASVDALRQVKAELAFTADVEGTQGR